MKRKIQSIVLAAAIASVIALILGDFISSASADEVKTKPIDFNREIRPIFSDNCFTCHGPDDKQRMAKMRLDTRDGVLGKPGVIVPGDSANSKLFKRISSKDPNVVMPPPESGHKLNEKQVDLIRRWIDEGAKWNEHWAFVAPKRPEIPKVKNSSWVRNPIDAFILSRLERENLTPSAEADRATLLRRVSLDLTGLPPTTGELDAFLADKSPDAYEKAVDRLLASPHYGERMSLQWLDLARYADSHGYHIDSHRDMWPWRDWVIRAFNENKPFDKFTIEQIAGDLLPNATTDQKIATGFNRNHMINFEGGAIPEEYLNEYIIDRVEATSVTWLGLTMGCARCHSHKFDPLSQKEFYQFYAFFNSIPEQGLDGRRGNAMPYLSLPTDEQKSRQQDLIAAIQEHETALSDKNIAPLQEAWEKDLAGKVAASPIKNLVAHFELDGSLADSSGRYRHGRTVIGDPTFGAGRVSRAVFLDGQTTLSFGKALTLDSREPFTLAVWLSPGLGKVGNYAFEKKDDEKTLRGIQLLFDQTQLIEIQRWAAPLTIRLISKWPEEAIAIRTKELFNSGDWKHLAITYDGSGKASGLKVWLNGKPAEIETLKDKLSDGFRSESDLRIGSNETGRAYGGGIDDLRVYDCMLGPEEIEQLGIHYPIQTILSGVSGKRTKDETQRLREYFITRIAPDNIRRQYDELKDLRKQKIALDNQILNTMVMMELGKPRDTFVLARGDYRNKTDKVLPGVPAVLPPMHTGDRPANRLDLAKWLVDPQHPLTARVAVNRFWQVYFGYGIAKTLEDFGSQGEQPVHPELLDWLATEFIRTSWDVKAMQRLIVTSATYRQSSKVSLQLLEKDPENRLLARGPRFRLQAELIRDNALAVSGLLSESIGGPSVLPYQPAGIWEELAFGDGFSAQEYVQSHGKDLYRRSMYTFWKRSAPPATMSTFDAPDREKCAARRSVTNTPLQALALLNDPTFVEAARALAARTLREGGRDVAGRINYAFRLATGRRTTPAELKVLRDLLNQQMIAYTRDGKAVQDLLGIGESKVPDELKKNELAAWTIVASTILNLDETVTKE